MIAADAGIPKSPNVLTSASTPAPPEGSNPAIVSALTGEEKDFESRFILEMVQQTQSTTTTKFHETSAYFELLRVISWIKAVSDFVDDPTQLYWVVQHSDCRNPLRARLDAV